MAFPWPFHVRTTAGRSAWVSTARSIRRTRRTRRSPWRCCRGALVINGGFHQWGYHGAQAKMVERLRPQEDEEGLSSFSFTLRAMRCCWCFTGMDRLAPLSTRQKFLQIQKRDDRGNHDFVMLKYQLIFEFLRWLAFYWPYSWYSWLEFGTYWHYVIDYYWLSIICGSWTIIVFAIVGDSRTKDDLDQLDRSGWCWSELPQSWDVREVALTTLRFLGRKGMERYGNVWKGIDIC